MHRGTDACRCCFVDIFTRILHVVHYYRGLSCCIFGPVSFCLWCALLSGEHCPAEVSASGKYVLILYYPPAAEGEDVQAIAAVLEELEDWQELAYRLDIQIAAINSINKNCASFERAQCQWRQLVGTYCAKYAAGDPRKTAEAMADILGSKMSMKSQAGRLKNLVFTSEFVIFMHACSLSLVWCRSNISLA